MGCVPAVLLLAACGSKSAPPDAPVAPQTVVDAQRFQVVQATVGAVAIALDR